MSFFLNAADANMKAAATPSLKCQLGDHVVLSHDYRGETGVITGQTTNMFGAHLWLVKHDESARTLSFYDHELTPRFKGPFSDSLSFGLRAAVARHPDEFVDTFTFVVGTAAKTIEEFEEVLELYRKSHWSDAPVKLTEAALRAWRGHRIVQPKLDGCCHPIGNRDERLYASFEDWRFAVAQHAPKWQIGWAPHNCEVTSDQVLAARGPIELYKLFPR